MQCSNFTRVISTILVFALLNLGFVQATAAASIDTATAARLTDRTDALERIGTQFARSDVRAAMVSLGVDPTVAAARVEALTDEEVAVLDRKLDQLPAAGDAGWILLVILLAVLVWLFATGKLKLN